MDDCWDDLDNDVPEKGASNVWYVHQDADGAQPCGRCTCTHVRYELRNVISGKTGERNTYARIFCSQCGAHTGWYDSYEDALAVWNTPDYLPRLLKPQDKILIDPKSLPVYDGT